MHHLLIGTLTREYLQILQIFAMKRCADVCETFIDAIIKCYEEDNLSFRQDELRICSLYTFIHFLMHMLEIALI